MADNVREFVVNSLQQIYEKIRKEDFILVEGTSSAAGSSSSPYLATRWEASIPGITEVFDGLKIAYRIRTNTGVSTGGVVLSIDEENYYPVVLNVNTKITTHYPIGSTILLIFNSTQTVSDVYLTSGTKTTVTGCWQIADYNTNTDTIGYSIRTNGGTLPAKFKTYRYRLLFTSADGNYWVGANASTSTNATSARTPTSEKINPFGPIVYYGTTTIIEANANFGAAYLWQQYSGISLGYSFNTGAALSLTTNTPIYLKCSTQADGSAIIDSTTPYVQSLPSTEDGFIYIFLGIATEATKFELRLEHPVYYYKDGAIRLWANQNENEEVISTAVNELNSYVHSSYAYILQTIEDNEFVIASTLTEHDERLIEVENALENVNYEETDPTVPNYIKNITQSNINTWNTVSSCVTKSQLSNQSYVTSSTLNTRLSNSSYAGYSYVYAAYSYIIDSMVSNERIIAAGFANHERRITTLEASGGEDNVQSNWNETDSTSDAYILNKPEIPSIEGLATESYVLDKISGLVNSAPGTLDTLNELAAALGNDPAFATTVSTQIGERVTKTELSNQSYVTETSLQSRGYLTSFTETDPVFTASPAHSITSTDITNWNNKVSNVQANWNTSSSSDQSYILNKPELVWEKGDGTNSAVLLSENNFGKNYANGNQAVAQGHHTSAYGDYSHTEGVNTFAGRNIILNDIWDVDINEGNHAEGLNTVAWGGGSHAEGDQTYTKGYASHAEGLYSYAYGQSSHAEGYQTVSYAAFSHAEGRGSYSAGNYSHAEGNYTNTYNTYEHAEGVANVSIKNSNTFGDSENTQFSIGIGEVKYPNNNEAYPPNVINRKNAFTIMQNGNAYFINVGNYNGTNLTSAKPLHTVLNEISSTSSSNVTESTVSGWGFTKNTGTLTGVKFNNTNAAINGTVAEITATIPEAVTESTVAGWGFTKNTGTLTSETDPTVPSHVKSITQANINAWNSYANVQADWNATSGDAYIKNKPTIPSAVTESTVTGWGFTKNAAANNSTITIQKGGTNVDTFTTNAASNKTINIPNELPTYSSSDAGKVLSINSSGQIVWITPVSIYTGSGEPNNSTGNNGDIYIQS